MNIQEKISSVKNTIKKIKNKINYFQLKKKNKNDNNKNSNKNNNIYNK